jgi:hypothetical protein
MAEHGTRARGKHSRHPAALAPDPQVTDGVHAQVQELQAALPEPQLDRGAIEAQLEELPRRDHPMLTAGEPGESSLPPVP